MLKNIKNIQASEIALIQYSSGGGYSALTQSVTVTIKIDDSGAVELTNNYNEDHVWHYEIDLQDYQALAAYISSHMNVFSVKERNREGITDLNTSHIIVTTKSGKQYETGGYGALLDDDFHQMAEKIIEAIGEYNHNSYREHIIDLK